MAGKALIPETRWLRSYGGASALKDTIAGLILSVLLVPQAMAYAQLAGLPPQTGLFAALLPPVLYLLFGTSNYVSLGPVALVSLVIAEAASGAGGEPLDAAVIIALEAGILLALLGGLGLGRLVNFISEPVLLGFTAAAAFLIAASQLPALLGIDAGRSGNLVDAVGSLASQIGATSMPTAIIGGAALLALLLAHRYVAPLLWKAGLHPPWRQAVAKSFPLLIIICAAFAASRVGNGVPTVQAINGGLPSLSLPAGGPDLWLKLLPSSLTVAVIVFVTATAVAKSLAGSDRSHLDTSREAVALGTANVAAALTGGYAVGASLSRSALVEDSGAASRVASVIASLVVLAVLLFLTPLLAYLPRTALAALVISAVFGLIKVREMRAVWRHDRIEAAIIAIAFLATLVFGVRLGLAIGAGAGLAHFLWFSSLPRVTRIGSEDGGESFRSVDRDAVHIDTLPALIIRFDRSIYFGNASYVENEVFRLLSRHEGVECVVLDMRAVNSVDASGAAMLDRMIERLHFMDIETRFAETHQPVREALAGLDQTKCKYHHSIPDALSECGIESGGRIAPT